MSPAFYALKRKFRTYWKAYLAQALFSVSVLYIILLVLAVRDMVVIASIGATSFIVFTMPLSPTASARTVIVSYIAGLLIGSLFGFLPFESTPLVALQFSAAVGCTIFFMLMTDTKHPPAAGAALGVAMTGFSWEVAAAVVGSALVLSAAHHFSKHNLIDFSAKPERSDHPDPGIETDSQEPE